MDGWMDGWMRDAVAHCSAAARIPPMDNDTALKRVVHGGTILCLDVPQGCVVGIDSKRFVVGPNFAGIKMIPPGTHYLSLRPHKIEDGNTGFVPSSGFFVQIQRGDVVVQRYDPQRELLVSLPDDEAERYAIGACDIDIDCHREISDARTAQASGTSTSTRS